MSETPIEKQKYIIVLGGIGDYLTMDYFYEFTEKNHIIFLSKQGKILGKLISSIRPQNKHYVIHFDFNQINKPGFNHETEMYEHIPNMKRLADIKIINIEEYFGKIQELINSQYRPNIYNYIIQHKFIPNICTRFNLPNTYAVIVPHTEDNRIECIRCNSSHKGITKCGATRNFVSRDFNNIRHFLLKNNIIGVVLSAININYPHNKNIINLSGKTSVLESIEIVKNSSYYFGIDGALSIIASRVISNKTYVKANNKHLYNFKDIYYFPYVVNIKIGHFISP